ncbi:hypothetical protein ACFL2I_00845 [Candidatus Omnitrophota bacterium]
MKLNKPAKPKILTVTRDVGGINAVLPVLRALWFEDKVDIAVIADKFAADILQRQNIVFRCKEDYGSGQDLPTLAEAILVSEQPTLVLTGTSVGANIEREVLFAAKSRGIPTLAVLDHWTNYSQRFEDHHSGEQFKYLPDQLAVMDQLAKAAAEEAGIPGRQIIVTGQPYLDDIVASGARIEAEQVRQGLGVEKDELMIVFASEPQTKDYGADQNNPDFLGYTELDALALLITALEEISGQISRELVLVVKLHPRETPDLLEPLLKQTKLKTILIKEISSRDLMVAAEVVTGMLSMFLIEAAYLGNIPLSIQPGARHQDNFVGNRVGLTLAAYNIEECKAQLLKIIQDSAFVENWLSGIEQRLHLDGNSAGRVTQLIYGQMGLQKEQGF